MPHESVCMSLVNMSCSYTLLGEQRLVGLRVSVFLGFCACWLWPTQGFLFYSLDSLSFTDIFIYDLKKKFQYVIYKLVFVIRKGCFIRGWESTHCACTGISFVSA